MFGLNDMHNSIWEEVCQTACLARLFQLAMVVRYAHHAAISLNGSENFLELVSLARYGCTHDWTMDAGYLWFCYCLLNLINKTSKQQEILSLVTGFYGVDGGGKHVMPKDYGDCG